MVDKIYSQNDEQTAILAACPELSGKFLDIGAWNAFDKSNTRALFERGWSGVLVEPSPEPFAGLLEEYRNSDRVSLVNALVGFDTNKVPMYVTADAVSTTHEPTYQKWKGYATYRPEPIHVQAVTLEHLFGQHGSFDFVSIDAEGMSVDLFHRLLALGHRPKCICLEYDDRMPEAMNAATRARYVATYSSAENIVLVRMCG